MIDRIIGIVTVMAIVAAFSVGIMQCDGPEAVHVVQSAEYDPSLGPGEFKTAGEKAEFMRLLKKHGLHRQVSVVCDWPEAPYFVRDGRRCAFR